MWICEHRQNGELSIADGTVLIKDYRIVSELSEAQKAKLHLLPRWKFIEDAKKAEQKTEEPKPVKRRRGRPKKNQ